MSFDSQNQNQQQQQQQQQSQRVVVKMERRNAKFLLREMSYSQHFSHVYCARLEQLEPRVKASAQHTLLGGGKQQHQQQKNQNQNQNAAASGGGRLPQLARVLDVSSQKGTELVHESLLVGTVYKNMPLFRPFLREYTAELVRLEAGDGEGDEDDEDGGFEGGEDLAGGAQDDALAEQQQQQQDSQGGGSELAAPVNICSEKDALVLEDGSGRIELGGKIKPEEFVTGVIAGFVGVVNEKGVFLVNQIVTPCASPPSRRILSSSPNNNNNNNNNGNNHQPSYLAFVSSLAINGVGVAPASIESLVDFLSGNLGDASTVRLASRIGRVIVAGGLTVETEESKLTQKVKLEPHDHTRLSEVSTGKVAVTGGSTSSAMRHVDRLLVLLGKTVPVEVIPGIGDPTNCFLPQQPIHPVMLPSASRSQAVRLVTNPYAFETSAVEGVTTESKSAENRGCSSFLVTSGQNVTDLLRQTKLTSPTEGLSRLLSWGHVCPTAPNSLPCFPFKAEDPFVVTEAPHCFVACNQQQFETGVSKDGVRLISVPKFSLNGEVVLVDIASPDLATRVVSLGVVDDS